MRDCVVLFSTSVASLLRLAVLCFLLIILYMCSLLFVFVSGAFSLFVSMSATVCVCVYVSEWAGGRNSLPASTRSSSSYSLSFLLKLEMSLSQCTLFLYLSPFFTSFPSRSRSFCYGSLFIYCTCVGCNRHCVFFAVLLLFVGPGVFFLFVVVVVTFFQTIQMVV